MRKKGSRFQEALPGRQDTYKKLAQEKDMNTVIFQTAINEKLLMVVQARLFDISAIKASVDRNRDG